MTRTRPLLLAAVTATLLAGCGQVGGETGAPDASRPADPWSAHDRALLGQTYRATELTVDGAPRPIVGHGLEITFSDGGIGVQAGCNAMSSRARFADGVITVQVMGGTEMACADPLMDQDVWVADFLGADPTYAVDGDDLTLTTGGAEMRLIAVADGSDSLQSTRWTVDGFVDGTDPDASVGMPAVDRMATVRFTDDGVAVVDTGCNTGSGRVEIDGDRLRIRGLVLTLVGCAGTQAAQERALVDVLQSGWLDWSVRDSTLELATGSGGLLLVAR